MAPRTPTATMLAGLALAASVVAADAEAPRVSAVASKAEVTVGEPFTVELEATGPAGTVFTFPRQAGAEQVELEAESTSPPAAAPSHGPRQRYQALVFAVGEARVPAVPVRYRLPDGTEGEVASAPLTVRVSSLLPKDPQEQKLADIRGPVGLAIGRTFWVALGALLLAAGGLGLWWWRRRRPKTSAAPRVPELAPETEARQALAALEAAGHLARGDYRVFYIALTVIAKRYLERRLAVPVVEMTSTEMVAFLRECALARDFAPALRDLAGAADQIKFARASGLAAEAERHLAAARALVDGLEQALRPAEAGAEKVA